MSPASGAQCLLMLSLGHHHLLYTLHRYVVTIYYAIPTKHLHILVLKVLSANRTMTLLQNIRAQTFGGMEEVVTGGLEEGTTLVANATDNGLLPLGPLVIRYHF